MNQMRLKSLLPLYALVLTMSWITPSHAAEDASMHEVYAAAESGRYNEAQVMMDKVLRDHPNSAKAHYVEAELLAKQGQIKAAVAELDTAERLQPGLPFAKPEAVKSLKSQILSSNQRMPSTFAQTAQAQSNSGFPWSSIFIGIGLIALIYMAARLISQRNSNVIPANNYSGSGPIATQSTPPIMTQNSGMGLGSSILGGLATGAAVGAGIVAGEALMHHFTDDDRETSLMPQARADENINLADDMGGTDFGIADNASWDDGTAGGDDWT